MKRMCPTEEKLSEYISGMMAGEEKDALESHLAGCAECRRVISEADDILNKVTPRGVINDFIMRISANKWLLGSMLSLALSFIIPRYFLQFLVACLIMGAKWIMDSRTSKILVMINEAWKRGDHESADRIISHLTKKQ